MGADGADERVSFMSFACPFYGKKRQIRNIYTQDISDELCKRLDEVKKGADTLEQLFNTIQTTL